MRSSNARRTVRICSTGSDMTDSPVSAARLSASRLAAPVSAIGCTQRWYHSRSGTGLRWLTRSRPRRSMTTTPAAVSIPLVHIADATAAAVRAAGLTQVALLGTRYTMERDFYRGRLETAHHLGVLVPEEPDRTLVHQVIYDELVQGVIRDQSRQRYLEIIGRLQDRGAEGVIAGCTEIELLVTAGDAGLPYFPTTRLHALAAVDLALSDS